MGERTSPITDPFELADRAEHYGLELLKLAATIRAGARTDQPADAIYTPTFPVVDGEELATGRLACCGSGTDRVDFRTGQRLHLPGCPQIANEGLAACRDALNGARS